MSKATTFKKESPREQQIWRKPIAVLGIAAAALFVLAYILFASLVPATVKISPSDGEREVAVDSELKVSTTWMRGTVSSVTVREVSLDPLGNPVSDRVIGGHLDDGGTFVTDGGGPLLKPDARYEVTVQASLTDLTLSGPRGRDVTESVTFQTIVTPAPVFLKEQQVVAMGDPIVVEFNTPVESFEYTLEPALQARMNIDEDNRTRAYIAFEGYEQGQKYKLTITGAVAENGAKLQKTYEQVIATTDPLKVVFVPGDGESGVSLGERPTLTFSEDIRNKELAEGLISMDPATLGGWEWVDDKTIEFTPLHDWTKGAKITIRLKGGTEALRGVSGSYLREDVESSFTTKPAKMIDVNLTTQTVTLYDEDKPVKTMICSSGSQATPSLTGTYSVYHKAEKVDMRGEGYFAPDVPWVIMFNGDYTIHGNYWATSFGTPSSHGCVGLPLPEAEYLYNWTPIGTIVSIHY